MSLAIGVSLPARGTAAPLGVEVSASESSTSFDFVTRADGTPGYATVLAIRASSDSAQLKIRICLSVQDCSDYQHDLLRSEYVLQPTTNLAYIQADVEDLGVVNLRNFSRTPRTSWYICPGMRFVISAVGPEIFGAGDAAGGTIGPWTVISGGCGLNARNVVITWAAP